MRAPLRRLALAAALAAALAPSLAPALPLGQALKRPLPMAGTDVLPTALEDVEVLENLGAQVPLELAFTDQVGRRRQLGELLGHGKPVILSLVYFDCPMLCGLVLTGMARGMRESGLTLGKEFDAVTLSFDPRDTTPKAAERQRGYLQAVGLPEAKSAWTFLTGAAADSRRLADAVGFKYAWDEKTRQFAHPAAIFVLTPDGRVSRYLYGIEYPARDVRLALVEASQGKVGTSFDRLLLTCYRYDPSSRTYEPYALGFVKVGMSLVLVALLVMLGLLWRREWQRSRSPGPGAPGGESGARPEENEAKRAGGSGQR